MIQSLIDWFDNKGFLIKPMDGSMGAVPMELFPHQRRILQHCFTPIDDMRFPYSTIVYSSPKKSGKTAVGAAIMAWAGECFPPGSEIYSIANDIEQAQSRAFGDVDYHVSHRLELRPTRYRIDYENGTFIQAIAQHYSSAAGARQALSLFDELWAYVCTDDQTEALTQQGWKNYAQLRVGDKIATLDTVTGEFVWNPIEALNIYPYNGQLHYLKHRRGSMALTPNHRVLGRFGTNGSINVHEQPLEFRFAEDAAQIYAGEIPCQADFSGAKPDTLMIPACSTRKPGGMGIGRYNQWPELEVNAALWMKLLGYYVSEGSMIYTQKGGPACAIFISQDSSANPKTYEDIRLCLDRLDFRYTENKHGFRVSVPQVATYLEALGKSTEKHIPAELKDLSPWLLSIFLYAYLSGDGWRAGKGYQCHTVSAQLADDLIEIGIKCGYIVRYMNCKKRGLKRNPIYRLSFSLGPVVYNRKNWSKKDYQGIVWCPTTATGTWLAKREGFVYWTGNSERSRRMWAEMTPPPSIPYSMRVVVTYAGFENESEQLLDLYNMCFKRQNGRYITGEVIPELADIVDSRGEPVCRRNGRTFIYWDHEPRMPWQTPEYYEEQFSTLRPSDFMRMHRNEWVSSTESFIPVELWDQASSKLQGPLTVVKGDRHASLPIVIGIDIGMKHDCSALVGTYYDSTRRKCGVAFHRIWTPPKDGSILDLESTVETELLKLWKEYNIISVVYDPAQFQRSAVSLTRKGIPLVEFTQTGQPMVFASQNLYDLLRSHNLEAYPDAELRDHIRYSAAEQTSRGFRLVKGKNMKFPIDAAIALAMSAYYSVNQGGADTALPLNMILPFADASAVRIPTINDVFQQKLPEALRD